MMSWLQPFSRTALIADSAAPPAAPAPEPSSFIPHPSSLPVPPSSDRPACSTAPASTVEPPGPAGSTPHTPCAVEGAGDQGPGTRESTPAPPPRVTLGVLVDAWVRADSDASARLVRLGAMADAWIAEQARHAVARPDAVRRLVERLRAEGLKGETLRVSRIVALSWLARLMGYAQAKTIAVSTLRALLPLIKRQARTGQWQVRPPLKDRAAALWARILAEGLSAAAVRVEVLKLRPARVAPPSRRRSARVLILRRLADLNLDDLAYIASACQEKLRAAGANSGPPERLRQKGPLPLFWP